MKNHPLSVRLGVAPAALLLLTASVLVGCQMVSTSPARSVSLYEGKTVPVVYDLVSNNVVAVSVDRNKEGVVLNATLDEYEMPTAWAKVTGTTQLYDQAVTPTGAQAALFQQGGDGAYYAKNIQIGTGTGAVVLQASASGTAVAYTTVSGSTTATLPATNLSSANQAWYWAQMAAGNYFILQNTTADNVLTLDYTKIDATTAAFTGATKINRWLKSANDSAWKTGRDAALAFVKGKVLVGASSLPLAHSGATWTMGTDDTQVPSTWSFDTYLAVLLKAYNNTTDSVDTTTAATE